MKYQATDTLEQIEERYLRLNKAAVARLVIPEIREYIEANGKCYDSLKLQAKINYKAGDYKKTLEICEEMMGAFPSQNYPHILAARTYNRQKRVDLALSILHDRVNSEDFDAPGHRVFTAIAFIEYSSRTNRAGAMANLDKIIEETAPLSNETDTAGIYARAVVMKVIFLYNEWQIAPEQGLGKIAEAQKLIQRAVVEAPAYIPMLLSNFAGVVEHALYDHKQACEIIYEAERCAQKKEHIENFVTMVTEGKTLPIPGMDGYWGDLFIQKAEAAYITNWSTLSC